MKKLVFLAFFQMFFIFYIFSLEVDVDEIKKGDRVIEFENYNGRYAYVNTVREVRSIGYYLARNDKSNEFFRYYLKYSIIHAVGDETDDRLSADIFSIDSDARVDHIRNIRLIISSYLERKYGYNRKQAQTLAVFITYYNAIYRGDAGYFSTNYKDVVLKFITTENAGISTKYYEWPGKTRIIIPLTDKAQKGKIDSLDTDELSDEKIIDEMRKEEDKKIEERKEMVNIKEEEIEEKKKEIEEEKKDINQEEEKIEKKKEEITKEKENIAEEKKDIEKKEDEINKEKEEAKKIEDPKDREKKEEEINKEEKKLDEEKEDIAKKEEDVDKKVDEVVKEEKNLDEKKEEVKKKEEEVAKKEENIAEEKKLIEKDEAEKKIKEDPEKFKEELEKKEEELNKKEEELKEKENELREGSLDEKIYEDKFYYLKIKEYMIDGHYNNEMYVIDAKSSKVIKKSPLEKICGRKYLVFKDGVIVISFKETHDSNHYLALLDLDTLDVKAQGQDNIFWRTFIEVYEEHVYAIIKQGDDYYLGKFNTKLERVALSEEKIDSATFISFYKNSIYINARNKDILVLNTNNLKKTAIVSPR